MVRSTPSLPSGTVHLPAAVHGDDGVLQSQIVTLTGVTAIVFSCFVRPLKRE